MTLSPDTLGVRALRPAAPAARQVEPAPDVQASRGRLVCIWVMLIFSVLPWRHGSFYSGTLDPVVAGKASLSLLCLAIAVFGWVSAGRRLSIGARSLALVFAYLASGLLGAWATGNLLASMVLTVRIVIVLLAVVLLIAANPIDKVLTTMCASMIGVSLLLGVTGARSLVAQGRLFGGLIPVNPNDIAVLLGPPALFLFWRLTQHRAHRWDLFWLGVCLGLTWLTGSRTGLAALAVALVVVVLTTSRVPVWVHVVGTAAVPVIFWLITSTAVFSSFFVRGDAQSVLTLSNRTLAWSAAFSAPRTFWDRWFGGGLALKKISVTGQFWETQVVDSSWVSAFVQAGTLGMLLLVVLMLLTLGAVARCRQPERAFWFAVAVYCLVRSITSSGLVDAGPLFLVFMVVALATERGSRDFCGLAPPPGDDNPAHLGGDPWGAPSMDSSGPR